MKKQQFSGFIEKIFSDNDKYSFYYDGKVLNMNLLHHEGVMTGLDKREDFLIAKLTTGGKVGLYRNVCRNNPFDETAKIYPGMIYLPKYINSTNDKFNRLLFKGRIVNQLFPPTRKVDYDSANDFSAPFDGSKTIKLKSFADTDIQFTASIKGISFDCIFGVYWPGGISQKDDNLGQLTSYFAISFEEERNIEDIPIFYGYVCSFFHFLTKQKDMCFDKIEVGLRSEKGKYDQVGFFIDNTKNSTEIELSYNISEFLPNIGNLFSIICERDINFNYIAKDSSEVKYVTPESYIKVCGAFEYNYENIFKSLPEKDQYKVEIINQIEDFLSEQSKKDEFNYTKRRYCTHIIETLKNDLNSIEIQYNRCLKHYKSAIGDFLSNILKRYELKDEKSLGKEFAHFRNKDAHGGLIRFTNAPVCAFIVGLVLIECMILDEAGYDFDTIRNIINVRYLSY